MKRGAPLERRTELRRTPMTRNTSEASQRAPRAHVKPMSDRRRAENAERRLVVAALLAEHPRCQLQWVCTGARSVDVHERLKRSRGGSITDPGQAHMVTTCRACHEATEQWPAEATRRRALLPSWHQCPPVGPC